MADDESRTKIGGRQAGGQAPRRRGLAPLRALIPYLRPYRGRLALGLTTVVASAALWSVGPWFIRDAIDGMRRGEPASHAYRLAAMLVAVSLAGGALRYWMREILNGLSRWVEFDLRNALFAALVRLDTAWYGRIRTGDVMARLTNDLGAVRMAAGPAIMYLTNTIVGGVFALAFMARISPALAGLALLPLAVIPVLMVRVGRMVHERFEAVQEHFATLTTAVQENLAGTRVVRAFRQEAAEQARFDALGEEYVRRNLRLAALQGALNPALSLFAGVGAVIVLGVGGGLVLQDRISVGDFVAFGLYLGMLTWPLIALGWVITLFQRGAASMTRLLDVLEAVPAVADPPQPRALPARAPSGGRRLSFRDVGFHYAASDGDASRWVLRHVSFDVPAGGTVGIIGATGAGKSSLLDLVPRLRDPQEGVILLDGIPLRELALADLRREIGYVPQESLLFSETIAENLRYGADGPGATDDAAAADAAARALDAARVAQLDEAVRGFPDGYDTMLGERGINLSGGQKQRAAIARALARDPAIVLLDDALSAVDTQTEAAILAGLRGALSRRTAIIAAHRASALRQCDVILVVDDGRVVEQGTHDALVSLQGRYWQLVRRQQLDDAIEETGEALLAAAGTPAAASRIPSA